MDISDDMTDGIELASVRFELEASNGAITRWQVDIYPSTNGGIVGRGVDVYRNGVSMGCGRVGLVSVDAGPSGQQRAQAKVYPESFPVYRVDAGDEAWLLKQLQDARLIESDASMQVRGIDKRHAGRKARAVRGARA